MGSGFRTDAPTIRSLSGVLRGRADRLHIAAATARRIDGLREAEVAAGLAFVRNVWDQALRTLGDGLTLTSDKIDQAVTVYERADETLGNATATTTRRGPTADF